MQIGNSFQMSALSLLRPLPQADAQGTQGSGGAVTAQAGGWGRRHDADRAEAQGSDDSRMQNRMQRLSAMLQRLTEANPDAQGASYAAIVLGGQGGAVAVASTSGPGQAGDTLVIQAQEIADISTADGNDSISLQGSRVTGVYSGGGSDAVAIVGTFVSGIHLGQSAPSALPPPPAPLPDPIVGGSPPAPPVSIPPVDQPPVAATPVAVPPVAVTEVQVDTTGVAIPVPIDTLAGSDGTDTLAGGAAPREVDTSGTATGPGVVAQAPTVVPGNDALSIAAYLIRDISTGAGNDAVALAGVAVGDVNTGAGDDTLSVKAVAVAGITGGDGNDTISVDAGIGAAGLSAAEGWFGVTAAPSALSAMAQPSSEAIAARE